MEKPTPTTPSTRPTPLGDRPPRAARAALAALAAAALLLSACGSSNDFTFDVTLYDLPAWDPEPESAEDAFLYPDNNMVIQSVDGREVLIGHGHWYGADYAETLYPLGPEPSTLR